MSGFKSASAIWNQLKRDERKTNPSKHEEFKKADAKRKKVERALAKQNKSQETLDEEREKNRLRMKTLRERRKQEAMEKNVNENSTGKL